MRHISVPDFISICESESMLEMQTNVYKNVSQFFTIYNAGETYTIDGDREQLKVYFSGCEDVYAKFGIYPAYAVPSIVATPEVICYLTSEDDFDNILAQYEMSHNCKPNYVVLTEMTSSMIQFIHDKIPEALIMNKIDSVHETKEETKHNKQYEYVDITSILEKACESFVLMDYDISAYKRALDEVRSLEHGPKIIFTIDSKSSARAKDLYVCVAAILTFDAYNFEMTDSLQREYLNDLMMANNDTHLTIKDYLYKLAHPLSIAVNIAHGRAYICALRSNGKKEYQPKDFDLNIIGTELTENKTLLGSEIEQIKVAYSELDLIDPIDYFVLDTSEEHGFAEVLENHKKVCRILSEFEDEIIHTIALPNNITLNLTNVILYRLNGKIYIGMIPKIPEVEYEYTMIPTMNKYHAFVCTLNVTEYDRLLDINVFTERDVIYKLLEGKSFKEHRHFKKPRFLDGMILYHIYASKKVMKSTVGLSFAEVGMWSKQTTQGRAEALSYLLTRFNRVDLHDQRFLTYWGGCHPMDLINLTVDYKIWRGGDN